MDDDIIIAPNFITRKQNQLLVMPAAALLGMCRQTLIVHKGKDNPMLPYLSQCTTIVEDGSVREECIINYAEICLLGKIINGKGEPFSQSFDKLILVSTLKSVSLWSLRLAHIGGGGLHLRKLCQVCPFTQITYMNRLRLTRCQFRIIKNQQESQQIIIEILCFTEINRVFKFQAIF